MEVIRQRLDGHVPTLTTKSASITLVAVCMSGAAAASLWSDYQRWLAMGPGGVPYDIRGWLICRMVDIFLSRPTRTLNVYEQPDKTAPPWEQLSTEDRQMAQKRFLEGPLPERSEPRTQALPYSIPQREKNIDEVVDAELMKQYLTAFNDLAVRYADAVEWRPSVLEKRGKAMFIKPPLQLPAAVSCTRGEICHMHSSDASGHVALSLADAREVVAKGWGERHALSGVKLVPLSYTMFYVPRNVAEMETNLKIVEAGIKYCTGVKG